jgi:mono/diheme cytochrome c family protein
MRLGTIGVGVVAVASGAFGGLSFGAPGGDIGRQEYQANCVACHGADGRGRGPYAEMLQVPVPDLGSLSARNGGVFPHHRVYRIIDGRESVEAHGTRDMPIWGQDYLEKAESAFFGYGLSREGFVRARILALIDYLHRLQAE